MKLLQDLPMLALNRCAGVTVAIVLAAGRLTGQTYFIDNTYPFGSNQAVASESSSNLIFEGSGSGIFVLNGAADQPALVTSPPGVINQLRPLGFVRDIVPTSDHLYVAASRNGIVRFNRTLGFSQDWTFPSVADAWAAEVVRVNGPPVRDVVLAGTNDQDTAGTLRLIWADPTSSAAPDLRATLSFSRPIYTMASWLNTSTNKWIVLVGTACGTVSSGSPPVLSYASLWRFDFDLSSGAPSSIPTAIATWAASVEQSPGLFVVSPTFVRDIVIDPETATAYAACASLGIRKFNLASGGLSEVTSGGWPILGSGQHERFTGLALHKPTVGENLLVGALGPQLEVERQWWGACSFPAECDSTSETELPPLFKGLRLWNVTGPPTLLVQTDSEYPDFPLKASVRSESSNAFRIDVANGAHGLQVLRATRSGSTWSLASIGQWAQEEGYPSSNTDDLVHLGSNLFASNENAVVAFDATATPGGPDLLKDNKGLDSAGVLLSALAGDRRVPDDALRQRLRGWGILREADP